MSEDEESKPKNDALDLGHVIIMKLDNETLWVQGDEISGRQIDTDIFLTHLNKFLDWYDELTRSEKDKIKLEKG